MSRDPIQRASSSERDNCRQPSTQLHSRAADLGLIDVRLEWSETDPSAVEHSFPESTEQWGKLLSVIEIKMTRIVDQRNVFVKYADYQNETRKERLIDLDNALLTLRSFIDCPCSPEKICEKHADWGMSLSSVFSGLKLKELAQSESSPA
jgi:hypothetical protein